MVCRNLLGLQLWATRVARGTSSVCRLADHAVNSLCGDVAFVSTATELCKVLGETDEIVDRYRDTNTVPPQLLAMANRIQRAQICIHNPLAWMTAHPMSSGDNPNVAVLLDKSCAANGRPVPSFADTSARICRVRYRPGCTLPVGRVRSDAG